MLVFRPKGSRRLYPPLICLINIVYIVSTILSLVTNVVSCYHGNQCFISPPYSCYQLLQALIVSIVLRLVIVYAFTQCLVFGVPQRGELIF